MPKSEIDDIFASKAQAKPAIPSKEKKKKKKKKLIPLPEVNDAPPPTKKRPLPETIVDTSAAPVKRIKTQKAKSQPDSTNDSFADSRGRGSRKKTEEGWAVYKEDELGISNEGGDTPECPFDCTCCF
ncbi:hypothetical protein ONZ45_g7290 [Pleurotus djamor]|nr:hypothetical protein ONZ45_g7290 [Pleurotus djamor]